MLRVTLLALAVGCRAEHPDTAAEPDSVDTGADADIGNVVVNELMASNHAAVRDPTGGWPDWVELYNPSDVAVGLDGWTLAAGDATHPLDGLTVDAGGWLLLWADEDVDAGPDHLPFRLPAEGATIGLYGPDGAPADGLTYGALPTDVSLGRAGDADATWTFFRPATPGATNGAASTPTTGATSWPSPGPACDLASDLSTADHLEGDTITFTVSCTGALTTGEADIELVNPPGGASFSAVSRQLVWSTGPADAARLELVFAARPHGDTTSIPSAGVVTVDVVDDPFRADAEPVDPATYPEEWGLPVANLQWTGEPNRTTNIDATFTWDGRAYTTGVQVHGRTSAKYPKLSYVVDFGDDELPMPDWGGQVNHLLLISTFDDNSYVRQKLAYDTWAAMAEHEGLARLTPRSFYTVVYINGEYQGLYLAVERIDDEFLDHMGFDRDANLYKAVEPDANFALTDAEGVEKTTLHQGFEKKEGLPEDDYSDLDALIAFTGGADPAEIIASADDHFDLAEAMDWLLLVFYAAAEDTTCKNMYLVSSGGPFHLMPWDFNAAWGQNWRTYRIGADFSDDFSGDNRVFAAINEHAEDELWARFAAYRDDGPFALAWQESTVDAYYALIDRSAARDWQKWGDAYRSYDGWAAEREDDGDWTDYEGEKAYLYQWLVDRAGWMGF